MPATARDGNQYQTNESENVLHFNANSVCCCPNRYKHDSSETTVDNIEFIATDGTNSVSFTQQIKVIY